MYQLKKLHDLFDLWYALRIADIDVYKVVKTFKYYMNKEGTILHKRSFSKILKKKIEDVDFMVDMNGLLTSAIACYINRIEN